MSEENEIQPATRELLEQLKNARPIPGFAFPGKVGIPGTDVSVVPGSGVRTYTDADIERIVAIACREQRYQCVDKFSEANPEWQGDAAISIQNAPAPKAADVLAEFEKGNGEKE